MAQYTNLSKSDIITILKAYNISNLISWSVLSGGSENTNYDIKTENNRFVLTICEQKSKEIAADLANLLEYLAKNNFSTSEIIRTSNNDSTFSFKNKPILLKKYLAGQIIEDLSPTLIKLIGKELGQLHQIKAPNYLPKQFSYGLEKFDEIKKYATNSAFHKWLFEMREYIQENISSDLPSSFIHGDLFFSNVIIHKEMNQATIMDFEEACNYYRVFDLGMSIIGLCCSNNTVNSKKVKALLEGYELHTQLLPNERKSLKASAVYAATATAFWRHKQYHYIHPDTTMQNHYLAMKNLADKIKGLDDDDFLSPNEKHYDFF